MQRSWKELVTEIVRQLPERFTLADVTRYESHLAASYPNNKHIAAKIRQTLQVLRNQGQIAFEGSGRYRRLDAAPRFSALLDFGVAGELSSRAQIARLVLETWAELNLYCLNCTADALTRLSANTPVADFECAECATRYQLKGKDGRFGPTITGAAYEPTIAAIRHGSCPEYMLLEYDTRFDTVVFGSAIRGAAITEDRVIPRRPLGETARRAGWVGCNIHVDGLPKVQFVRPAPIERGDARADWSALLAADEPTPMPNARPMVEKL